MKINSFFILCFLTVSVQAVQAPSKDECAAELRKTVACMVGQESLDDCQGCKSVAQILKECVNKTTFSSQDQLRAAASDKSEEMKDPSLVSLALIKPQDSLVIRKCFIRCTQRLVRAQECELNKGEGCQGVASAEKVLEECKPYFDGGKTGFYNYAMQYRMAKEYASNNANVHLVLALQSKQDYETFLAHCKVASVPTLIFAFFAAAPYIFKPNSNSRGY